MNKKASLLLCFAAVICLAAGSCSGQTNAADKTQPPADTAAPAGKAAEGTDDPYDIADGLPEADFGGYVFRIYTFDNAEKIVSGEQAGEVINDAVYEANAKVSERFNVKLKNFGQNTNESGFTQLIRSSILAGDDAFDMAFGHDTMTGSASLQGLFLNLLEIPHLDFDKPWWPSGTVRSLTVNGRYYLGTSDISYLGMHWTKCLYVNKTKLAGYGVGVPYQDVLDGEWTFDSLISLTRDTYEDLNGNAQADPEDFYGYATANGFSGYVDVCGIEAIKAGADGKLELGLDNEHTVQVVGKLYSWLIESRGTYVNKVNDGQKFMYPVDFFNNGYALFAYDRLGDAVDSFRYGEIDYGILPMPKYSQEQENYISSYFDRLFVVPKTASDTERTGMIIEAMSAEGYRTVTPAYFDTALKHKFTTDSESVKMLDIVKRNRVMDFSYVYGGESGVSNVVNSLLSSKSMDFASFYASKSGAAQAYVDKLNKIFSEME